MGFLDLLAKDAALSVVVFHENWEKYHSHLQVGQMGLYELLKTDRGYQLKYFMNL